MANKVFPESELNLRRFAQEIDDTRRRIVVGGSFYVLGWLLVVLFTPIMANHPLIMSAVGLYFIALAIIRVVMVPPPESEVAKRLRWLTIQWVVVQCSAAGWGALLLWTLLDPILAPARIALMIGTAGFATAIANTYCMRFWASFIAIVVMYVPGMMLMWMPGYDRATAFSLTVYLAYVFSTLIRSHREYQRRLDADEALRQQRDQFETLSHTDSLTGLANRRHFVQAMRKGTDAAADGGRTMALLVLDIDHFKVINDAHGHAVGDQCLAGFAAQLQQAFSGDEELCARLGGEEFAVLVPQFDESSAALRADAFRAELSAATLVRDVPSLRLRVSIGVGAFSLREHGHADHFFREVDRALYRAKGRGRDRVCKVSEASY